MTRYRFRRTTDVVWCNEAGEGSGDRLVEWASIGRRRVSAARYKRASVALELPEPDPDCDDDEELLRDVSLAEPFTTPDA